MTVTSPPPSPNFVKPDIVDNDPIQMAMTMSASISRDNHPTLPSHAVNRHLYYNFPSPPLSPTTSPAVPRSMISPRTLPSPSRRHIRNTSRSATDHTRRRSSLSTSSFHSSQITEELYGPPPHPAPTAPLPPTPGAPRIPFTTPQQERIRCPPTRPNRYSSYDIFTAIRTQTQQQHQIDEMNKRHSAPITINWAPSTSTPRPEVHDLTSRRDWTVHLTTGEDITGGIRQYEDTRSEEREI